MLHIDGQQPEGRSNVQFAAGQTLPKKSLVGKVSVEQIQEEAVMAGAERTAASGEEKTDFLGQKLCR